MKTTAKHFAAFRQACEQYRQKLGLTDWAFEYRHSDEHGHCLAAVHRANEDKIATIVLSTEGSDTPVTPAEIREAARHEVLHVLLAELEDLAMSRVNPRERWAAAEHAVIHRIEKFI